MLETTQNLIIMFFPDIEKYFFVRAGIVYNENVQGREIFDKGDISISDLETLFLSEYPNYTRL